MNQKVHIANQLSLKDLTPQEKGLLMGTLLGDAHIQRRGNSCRLKIAHSINQLEYVEWKHRNLIRLCNNPKPKLTSQTKKDPGQASQVYEGAEFYTASGIYTRELHDLFYAPVNVPARSQVQVIAPGQAQVQVNAPAPAPAPAPRVRYVKVITPALLSALPKEPILLASFFMDDGSVRDDCFAGKIATQGYTLSENQLLQDYLRKTWGVNTAVVKHTLQSGQYYLSLPARSFGDFVDIIKSTVRQVPSMKYKIKE